MFESPPVVGSLRSTYNTTTPHFGHTAFLALAYIINSLQCSVDHQHYSLLDRMNWKKSPWRLRMRRSSPSQEGKARSLLSSPKYFFRFVIVLEIIVFTKPLTFITCRPRHTSILQAMHAVLLVLTRPRRHRHQRTRTTTVPRQPQCT